MTSLSSSSGPRLVFSADETLDPAASSGPVAHLVWAIDRWVLTVDQVDVQLSQIEWSPYREVLLTHLISREEKEGKTIFTLQALNSNRTSRRVRPVVSLTSNVHTEVARMAKPGWSLGRRLRLG